MLLISRLPVFVNGAAADRLEQLRAKEEKGTMNIKQQIKSATITGVVGLMVAVGASASTVTFQTDIGTGFNGTTTLSLNQFSGAAATLAFVPDPSATTTPGNVNYGNFTLACALCTLSTATTPVGAIFNGFTFNLRVTDTSDVATGQFVGTALPGAVYLDTSTITLNWVPLQLGPGTSNALSGNFLTTSFNISPTTRIVNPTSGAQIGSTTVQGTVATGIPEPATIGLIGAGLLGLGVLRRKHFVV
jgi:hypothetical protein